MIKKSSSVVVTGASSGIGEATALHLDRAGWRVFAGVRREDDGRALVARGSPRMRWLVLDVTDEAAIARARTEVDTEVGAGGLDALVNNAGIAMGGPLEFLPLDSVRRQFDVNVFGLVAVTQAFLPLLRRARGRIVNVGSISGRVASPMIGPYTGSKHAVEGLSDALRMELAPWNLHTVVIEPGVVRTPIWDKSSRATESLLASLPAQAVELYGMHLSAMRRVLDRAKRTGTTAERVAAVIERALTARRPRARYVVGTQARIRLLLQHVIPRRWMDALVLRVLRRAAEAA